MLDRKGLDQYGPPGFTLGQKEKDYVQHWLLSYLSRTGFAGVFKGGTCLQKAFQLPRYSEDLDFTLADQEEQPDADNASAFLASAGFSEPTWKTSQTPVSKTAKLRVRGPLYMGKPISECTVQLEFSLREKTRLEPVITSIQPPYPDVFPYALKTMDATEIAAEKIRAILTRQSARDLYDLYFLLRRNAVPDKELVNGKLTYYEKTFNANEFQKRVRQTEKIWKTEMNALSPNPVDFDDAARLAIQKMPK
ncbi:nucleotidyl transferase AbiEii/AbiGii toxin family protein [Candidatus Micrarchaeota archaeon]|nr:nucleotidyl transferase AbiEii/AbiGii toxin family protein [Candidatus Micrarchaeota archaeon]